MNSRSKGLWKQFQMVISDCAILLCHLFSVPYRAHHPCPGAITKIHGKSARSSGHWTRVALARKRNHFAQSSAFSLSSGLCGRRAVVDWVGAFRGRNPWRDKAKLIVYDGVNFSSFIMHSLCARCRRETFEFCCICRYVDCGINFIVGLRDCALRMHRAFPLVNVTIVVIAHDGFTEPNACVHEDCLVEVWCNGKWVWLRNRVRKVKLGRFGLVVTVHKFGRRLITLIHIPSRPERRKQICKHKKCIYWIHSQKNKFTLNPPTGRNRCFMAI